MTRYRGDDEAAVSVDYDGGLQAAADDGRVAVFHGPEGRPTVTATPPEVAAELVAFLLSPESAGISGRLISAVWDPWREASGREKTAPRRCCPGSGAPRSRPTRRGGPAAVSPLLPDDTARRPQPDQGLLTPQQGQHLEQRWRGGTPGDGQAGELGLDLSLLGLSLPLAPPQAEDKGQRHAQHQQEQQDEAPAFAARVADADLPARCHGSRAACYRPRRSSRPKRMFMFCTA